MTDQQTKIPNHQAATARMAFGFGTAVGAVLLAGPIPAPLVR